MCVTTLFTTKIDLFYFIEKIVLLLLNPKNDQQLRITFDKTHKKYFFVVKKKALGFTRIKKQILKQCAITDIFIHFLFV